jgi:hypothetical protein
MDFNISSKASESFGSSLEPIKTLILFSLVVIAITAPSLLARIDFLSKTIEPAFGSIIIAAIVSLLSYPIIRYGFPEFSNKSWSSTAIILGLISGHVAVYSINDKLPSIPVYGLFIFLFYYHFDEGVTINSIDQGALSYFQNQD